MGKIKASACSSALKFLGHDGARPSATGKHARWPHSQDGCATDRYIARVVTTNLSPCNDAILMCRQRLLASACLPDSRWKLSLKLRLNDCMKSLVRIALGNTWLFA